ncbi:MAG: hypothetical protein Q7S32_01540, partial [bacterium]|nr:hypothetical protein [bacterium]
MFKISRLNLILSLTVILLGVLVSFLVPNMTQASSHCAEYVCGGAPGTCFQDPELCSIDFYTPSGGQSPGGYAIDILWEGTSTAHTGGGREWTTHLNNVAGGKAGTCEWVAVSPPAGWNCYPSDSASCPTGHSVYQCYSGPPPTCNITANPPSGTNPTSGTLSWTTGNSPTSCTAYGGWSGSKSVSGGSQAFGPISTSTTYGLTCTNSGGDVDCSTTVTISTPTNNAACLGLSAPTSVTTGQTFSAQVSLGNNGTKPWTTDGTPHRLGSQDPQDTNRWGLTRVDLPSQPINTGQGTTFSFSATAPATAGTYPFSWQMVEEGVGWFGTMCSQNITVTSPPGAICSPKNHPAITTGQAASFSATGGNGVFNWTAAGGSPSSANNNPNFSTTYSTPGTKTVSVISPNGSAVDTCQVVVNPTVSCGLTAFPDSGNPPLNNVSLTGNVSGSATGNTRYQFDCTNDGSYEVDVTSATAVYATTGAQRCNYATAGVKTALLRVTRQGVINTCTATINVAAGAIPSCFAGLVDFNFTATQGTNPLPQNWTVWNSGDVGSTLQWRVTSPESWIVPGPPSTGSAAAGVPININTTGLTPGTYVGSVVMSDNGSSPAASNCPRSVAVNLTVNPPIVPTLSVSLAANPSSGVSSLNSILTATVGGTATGTINYAFWWSCTYVGTSMATAITQCGDPDGTAGNAIGNRWLATNTNPRLTVPHLYNTVGNYSAKVIVERGVASPAEARLVIPVTGAAPTGSTACFGFTPAINLSWPAYPGTTNYQVHRNGVLYQDVGLVTNFTDNSVGPSGTSFTYTIRIQNSSGTIFSSPLTIASSWCSGDVIIQATMDGSSYTWSGAMSETTGHYHLEHGASTEQGYFYPTTFPNLAANSFTLQFISAPAGAIFSSITPSSTQVLPGNTASKPTITFTVNFIMSASPTASVATLTEPNYCASGPAAALTWNFNDPDGGSQSAYQVQIDDNSNFSSPEWDSGTVSQVIPNNSTGSHNTSSFGACLAT